MLQLHSKTQHSFYIKSAIVIWQKIYKWWLVQEKSIVQLRYRVRCMKRDVTILNYLISWQLMQSPDADRVNLLSWKRTRTQLQEMSHQFHLLIINYHRATFVVPSFPLTFHEETFFSKSYKMTKGSTTKVKQSRLSAPPFLKNGQWTFSRVTKLLSVSFMEENYLLWSRIIELVLPGPAEASLHATISP